MTDAIVGGKWRLERKIRDGAETTVWAARHAHGYAGALKILHTADPAPRARFLRQGSVANKVGHVGAVLVLDEGTLDDGSPYVVTELVHGESLDVRLAREPGPFGRDEAVGIIRGMLRVLGSAHAVGIVHGSVSPGNVMIARGGSIHLLGFGRLERKPTPFTAPERAIVGRALDARADVWSAGILLFHLLTRQPDGAPRRLSLAEPLLDLLSRATAMSPEGRFGDARAMLVALDRATNAHPDFEEMDTVPLATLPRIRRAPTLDKVA